MNDSRTVSKFFLLAVLVLATTSRAWALPSYAQQTSLACQNCHTLGFGPQLTPFGAEFKQNGYNVEGNHQDFVPIAAMVVSSFTHTNASQEGGAAPHFAPNNNAAVDQTSLFYAGCITDHLGAFVQVTYDGVAQHLAWDNFDLRYADRASLAGTDFVWGVTLNNNPTVQDLWNTAPAWSFPYASSAVAPAPAAAPLIEGGLAQQVYGLTAYTTIEDLLYLEFGGYKTLPPNLQSDFGQKPDGENRIRGTSPYWRAALKHQFGAHYAAVGLFGMHSKLYPGSDSSAGNDSITDLGYDATYFGLFGAHLVELQATVVQELQKLPATFALGGSANTANHLQTRRFNVTYAFQQTYAATLGHFAISGSADQGLFPADPIGGSANGDPGSRGFIGELSYTPFGQSNSLWRPWLNARLGLQYTWYDRFNGGRVNYDGSGRSAADNNTLFAFIWLAI